MKMVKKTYQPVGVCIYCGSTSDLRLEHVIPAGLGGNIELPDASCSECEKITSNLELKVLRGELLPTRSAFGLRKKKKKVSLKSSFPVIITTNNKKIELDIDAKDLPSFLPLAFFDFPGHLKANTTRADELRVTGTYTEHSKSFVSAIFEQEIPELEEVKQFDISRTVDFDVHAFARMLAKSALGFAIGEIGYSNFKQFFVQDIILGRAVNTGRWVGGDFYASSITSDDIHALRIRLVKNEVHVKIQLFAKSSGAPVYTVIVGTI